ncbi:MAG: hypothetical protein ACRD4Y_07485 [Candidatus Acidiferrales bacterium]
MEALTNFNDPQDVPEQRLWRAVLTSTVEEWFYGPLRKQREAEQFLLHDTEDYPAVCSSAGIDPAYFRRRLIKMRDRANAVSSLA